MSNDSNLYRLFRTRFPSDLSMTFIETGEGRVFSYRDLEQESARYARFMTAQGLSKGDRVAVQVDKSPQALFLYFACLRAGLVFLPLNTAYRSAELAYFLNDAEPGIVVCQPENREAVQALAQPTGSRVFTMDGMGDGSFDDSASAMEPAFETVSCAPDDLAALLYTSGTTGRSKGAMLSHHNLAANALVLHETWGWTRDDVLLHALPLFHIHGLFVATHCVLLNGTGMIFLSKFDPKTVCKHLLRTTVFMGVPTYYTRLLEEPSLGPNVCRSMRLFISGSAPLLQDTFNAFNARTGHTILERYGMSETCMIASNPLQGPRVAGAVGLPLRGVSVRVADGANRPVVPGQIGEIQVKGENVFLGYWRMPEKTREAFTEDGFFCTGDLGKWCENGYLAIVGRSKDLVITGGYNVYPKEIELCIDQIEGVAESAVIGIPHPDFGEAVVAVVVRDGSGTEVTEHKIISTLKPLLANYKVPKQVCFVDQLPRNAMGKVQKKVLREMF